MRKIEIYLFSNNLRTGMKYPNFYFERRLWKKGCKLVAGVDEVGRGCFAGPVVTAAVVFKPLSKVRLPIIKAGKKIYINDSKKLTKIRREKAERWIKKNVLVWGIGEASASEINRKGMTAATLSAFRRAVTAVNKKLSNRVEYLLIDAFYIPYIRGIRMPVKSSKIKNRKLLRGRLGKRKQLEQVRFLGNQLAIIKGDEKSISISSASIIAKVYRDNMMKKLGSIPRYKKYCWAENKGYGTRKHQAAIKKFGINRYHRKSFVATFLNREVNIGQTDNASKS
jgi:ribonuclease HII